MSNRKPRFTPITINATTLNALADEVAALTEEVASLKKQLASKGGTLKPKEAPPEGEN